MANTKWEQRAHYIVSFKNGEVDTCNTHDPSTRTISYFWCEINKNILGACQCWEVLIFLWEPAGSGSLMMLREPHRFSNIHHFFGLMSSSQVVTFLVFSTLNPENSENRIWVLWENLSGSYIYIYICIHLNRFSWPVLGHVRTWGWLSHLKVSIGSHCENQDENRVENRVSI